MAAKPPLSCCLVVCSAAEVWIDTARKAKVVFATDSTCDRYKPTSLTTTVNMQGISVNSLPPSCCGMDSHVATDVYILHLLASSISNEGHDVEGFEVPSDVVPVVNSVGWIAASRPPVCRVAFDGLHTGHRLSVQVEVWHVVIDGRVLFESQGFKLSQATVLIAPGHDQGPGISRLGLHVTVHGETVAVVVVDFVNAAL